MYCSVAGHGRFKSHRRIQSILRCSSDIRIDRKYFLTVYLCTETFESDQTLGGWVSYGAPRQVNADLRIAKSQPTSTEGAELKDPTVKAAVSVAVTFTVTIDAPVSKNTRIRTRDLPRVSSDKIAGKVFGMARSFSAF